MRTARAFVWLGCLSMFILVSGSALAQHAGGFRGGFHGGFGSFPRGFGPEGFGRFRGPFPPFAARHPFFRYPRFFGHPRFGFGFGPWWGYPYAYPPYPYYAYGYPYPYYGYAYPFPGYAPFALGYIR